LAQLSSPSNLRSASNPNGLQALSCSAVRSVGARQTARMELSMDAAGRLVAVEEYRTSFGRWGIDGSSGRGSVLLELQDEAGVSLVRYQYEPSLGLEHHVVGGGILPRPLNGLQLQLLRLAVPDTVNDGSRLALSVFLRGALTSRSTLNGGAPSANAGADLTIECSAAGRGLATMDGRASLDPDGDLLRHAWSAPGVTFDDANAARATGSFPLGSTTVTLSVSDAVRPAVSDTAIITVRDSSPPRLQAPPATVISTCNRPPLGMPSAEDACGGEVTISNDAPAVFPLGATVVTWTARDIFGNASTATQVVTAILGDDSSCCPPGTRIQLGSDRADVLIGWFDSDCILGRGGDDVIVGGFGRDYLSGGAGDDRLSGGHEDDLLFGGAGNDWLEGGWGADRLEGAQGRDVLRGEFGDDQLSGGPDFDICDGDFGRDTVSDCELRDR
jgi:hypothetical protein